MKLKGSVQMWKNPICFLLSEFIIDFTEVPVCINVVVAEAESWWTIPQSI